MPQLKPFLTQEQIAAAVTEIAGAIRRDYGARSPLLVGVLKGAFVFLADLVRALALPVEVGFVRLASYGQAMASGGSVTVVHDIRENIAGRDVLIVEGIIDSGRTVAFLQALLAQRHPASLRLCTLLDKPARRRVPVAIDYWGFRIPDVFVVGYGLDWGEQYRHLPHIAIVDPAESEREKASPRGFEPLLPD